ncbi:MAG: DUF1553 domain-containing protein [Planctomycetes bacterium]|nr:DUF1553 domain-containing protein [Planctomycetota bacterium]
MMNRKLILLAAAVVAVLVGMSELCEDQTASAQSSQSRGKTKASMKRGQKPAAPKTNLPTGAEKTKVEIEPVKPELRDAALKSAAKIDELVEAGLKKAGQKPNEMSSPEHFVRRAYLDITGTIPNFKQTEAYLTNKSESNRIVLIDSLLSRPGYASQMYNWMADILRLVDRVGNNNYLRPYSDWVKECLQDNEPWDSMVHDMLTAEGRVWDEPAAGFVMRDPGMPLDNLNNAVRIFLGTRIGCAQCHDHPFDKWTQKEFYSLAAFTAGIEYLSPEKININNKDIDKASSKGGKESNQARQAKQLMRLNRGGVSHNDKKQLKFPHDYQYSNAKPEQIASPAVLWGTAPSKIDNHDRRKTFADWVASADNPRFALTMANRLWQKAMGIGLIEPADDMKDETKATNPELMEFLAKELVRLKFNMKEFQRIIYYSKTYQHAATYAELDPEKPYLFPGPLLRRMTSEQVWDSLLTLTMPNPEMVVRPDDSEYVATVSLTAKTTATELLKKVEQLAEVRKEESKEKNKRLYKGQELVRASELPQPLPDGHFLRQFGQSDRQTIADSHTDGTVPQLLTMFNGPVTHMMLEQGSVIYNEVTQATTTDGQINKIFVILLNRHPTTAEKAVAQREIKLAGPAGIGNVIWALLNTREFLFVQ